MNSNLHSRHGHQPTGIMKKRLLSAAIAGLMAAPLAPVHAQTIGGAAMLEEIVITARKREEGLQSAPIAVTAISDVNIDQRSIGDISEVANFAPNVTFFKSTGVSSDDRSFLYIRGVGQEGVFITNDPGVGTYIDGIYLGRTQGALTRLLDRERVEILRGPQGTLFGRNTIGGAVNIVTKKPQDTFGGYVEVEAGNWSLINGEAKVNIPFTNNFYGSLAVGSYQHDGYIDAPLAVANPHTNIQDGPPGSGLDYTQGSLDQPAGQDQRDDDTQTAMLGLRWLPTDSLEINFKADGTTRDAAGGGMRMEWIDLEPSAFPTYNRTFFNTTPCQEPPKGSDGQTLPPVGGQQCSNQLFVPGPQPGQFMINPAWAFFDDNALIPQPDGTFDPAPNNAVRAAPDGGFNYTITDHPLYGANNATLASYQVDDQGRRVAYNNFKSKDEQDIYGTSLTFDWRLNESLSFKSLTGYRELEMENAADNDGSPADLNFTAGNTLDQDQFSQEFQLLGNTERLDWVFGLYYFEENAVEDMITTVFPLPAIMYDQQPFTFNQWYRYDVWDYSVENYAAFGETTIKLTDKWSIIAGLRYNDEDKEIRFGSFAAMDGVNSVKQTELSWYEMSAASLLNPMNPYANDVDPRETIPERYQEGWTELSDSWDATTWKFGVEYQANEDLMYYVTASNGFKSGTFNLLQPASNPTVDAERVDAYELGMKSDWFNNRLRVNGAVFYSDYTDQQIISGSLIDGSPIFGNLGESKIYGAELETMVVFNNHWSVDGNLGYTGSEIDKAEPGSFFEQDVGNELPFVPEWNAAFGVTADYNVGVGDLMVRADYNYRSGWYPDTSNNPWYENKGYGLWNLRVALRMMGDSLEVYGYVKNLFDHGYNQATSSGQGLPNRTVILGDPRQWAMGVKYLF